MENIPPEPYLMEDYIYRSHNDAAVQMAPQFAAHEVKVDNNLYLFRLDL